MATDLHFFSDADTPSVPCDPSAAPARTLAALATPSPAPIAFLVVDDEPDAEVLIRHHFRRKIRSGEYVFLFAGDGAEALQRLGEHPEIQIVLSDINMPKMDGLGLLAKVAELDRLLKVVMVSAYGDLDNLRTAMNRGAFDFVTKPIDFDDLEATVAKTLRELDGLHRARDLQDRMGVIQHDLEVARRIQLSMLPDTFPDRDDLDLHALASPAKEVGGDFYDVIETDDGRLGFVVGDVAGKGLGAALFMAITRTVLHAAATERLAVEACVRRANDLLEAEARRMAGMFATAIYGEVDGRTGEVTYCSAGHNPPLLLRRDGSATFLPSPQGPALCLAADIEFQAARTTLAPGDTLLLYTDGVTEAFNPRREEYSEGRLARTGAVAATRGPQALLEHVLADVRTFADGTPQSDDITLMAFRYRGGQ